MPAAVPSSTMQSAVEQNDDSRAIRLLRGTRKLSKLFLSESEAEKLCDLVSRNLIDEIGYYSSLVLLVDDTRRITRATAAGNNLSAGELNRILLGQALPSCLAPVIDSDQAVAAFLPSRDCQTCILSPKCDNRSGLAVPLRHLNRLFGAMIITAPADWINNQLEKDILRGLADDFAFALEAINNRRELLLNQFACDHASDAVFWLDHRGDLVYVNHRASESLGYSREELTRMSVFDIDPDFRPETMQKYWQEISQVQSKTFESRHRHRSGRTFPVEISVCKGIFAGRSLAFAFVRDIRRRKQTEARLSESEKGFRLVLEAVSDGVWDLDVSTGKIHLNPRGREIFGLEQSNDNNNFTLADVLAAVYPEDQPRLKLALARYLGNTENVFREEFRVLQADGSIIWVICRGRVVSSDDDGKALKIVGTNTDITYRKKNESERALFMERLAQARKMESLGTLASGIAHDFNNVLTPIIGHADLLKEKLASEGKSSASIEAIIKGAQRASELVKQILSFSRGEGSGSKQTLDPNITVREAIKFLQASLPRTVNIKKNLNPDCGRINADPTKLFQICLNLCTNAFQALKNEKGQIGITLEKRRVESTMYAHGLKIDPGFYVVIEVADDGCGLSEKNLNRIFDPYFTTKDDQQGTGLGLAIVHGIVKSYNGLITTGSKPGVGTSIGVYLPEARRNIVIAEEKEADQPTATRNEKILLIDDEEAIINLYETVLKVFGYQPFGFTDSRAALADFKNRPDFYDLIITDQSMPGLTGIEVSKQILAIRPGARIILSTGYSAVVPEKTALASGIRRYLKKPVEIARLRETIREVLSDKST